MKLILQTYGLPKETVAAIIMLYKDTKVKVCSLDGNTDFFDIVAGRYISPISVHNLLRLRNSNVDRSNERKWPYTKKDKKQKIPRTNYYGHRLCRCHHTSCK